MTYHENQSHSAKRSLSEWLSYLEHIHAVEIDLGLERISFVATRLALTLAASKVITVAGTNGKGTTCAFLETAFLAQGKSVAVYSSPHITLFNERLRINRQDIDDQSLISAFEQVETARAEISLTYYEFTTLAALLILMAQRPDVIILEVGLGGRLDATNIIDADISVITAVDLDHQAFLGDTREQIGKEKAGIMRANKPAVIGDLAPPESVLVYGNGVGAQLYIRQQDFSIVEHDDSWQWQSGPLLIDNLALPHIPLDNVATSLQVLTLLGISLSAIRVNQWIAATRLAGRTELYRAHCDVLLDVGHNPHATRYLAKVVARMKDKQGYPRVHAVLGMLKDKDISGSCQPLVEVIDQWYVGSLAVPRGAMASDLAEQLAFINEPMKRFDNLTNAFKMAVNNASSEDLILVFGSFYTVAEIRALLL